MDLRDSKSRLILIVAALGAALVIAVASCGGGGGDNGDGGSSQSQDSGNGETDGEENSGGSGNGGGEEDGSGEVLAEVSGEENITLTITSAEREEGGFLTVEGTITNEGSETWFASVWAGDEEELAGNGFSMAGASLVAQEEGHRYLILRDTSGRCLCTNFGNGIEAGETLTWFAQFPEPEASTTQVDFQVGNMPPATIEIR